MTDGKHWFSKNYDLVFFHNNYPHYDTPCTSNADVLRSILNGGRVMAGTVGGSQGYFGATGGIYYNGCDPDNSADSWGEPSMQKVIYEHELCNDPGDAQTLFIAMHYVDDQWNERDGIFSAAQPSGEWHIGEMLAGDNVDLTGVKTGYVVGSYRLTDSPPTSQTVKLHARWVWNSSTDEYDQVKVSAKYDGGTPAAGVTVYSDGTSKGDTGSDGTLSWYP
jgi:hypothetical protein